MRGRFEEAHPLATRVLENWTASFGADHPYIGIANSNLGAIEHGRRRPVEAERFFRRAMEIYLQSAPDNDPNVLNTRSSLGAALHDQGRLDEAARELEACVALHREAEEMSPLAVYSLAELASVYLDQSRAAEAEPLLRDCLRLRREHLADDAVQIATTEFSLALCLGELGRAAEADSLFRTCEETALRSPPQDPERRKRGVARAIRFYEQLGREDRAARIRELAE
jgi:tetratricopeptide (TPR) repeat protein